MNQMSKRLLFCAILFCLSHSSGFIIAADQVTDEGAQQEEQTEPETPNNQQETEEPSAPTAQEEQPQGDEQTSAPEQEQEEPQEQQGQAAEPETKTPPATAAAQPVATTQSTQQPAEQSEKTTEAEQKEVAEPVQPEEPKPVPGEALDTIDLEEGGNWLLKRKALEDTADTIEKIVNTFSKILEASTTFKIKRNKLDNDYDLYIATVGFNLGDLDQVLTNLMNELEKQRIEVGELSADERAALDSIKEKQNTIKQLQEDLKALASLDEEIDKVVDTVDSQIKTANNYQNQAWKNFQEIKKVLSDEKAEELFYKTVSLQTSMQEIYNYLTNALSSYFSTQIDTLRNKMETIKNQIGTLQTQGIDLQKEIEKLEQEDATQEEEREKEEQKEEEQAALKKALQKRQESSWLSTLKNIIYWPFTQVAHVFNFIADSIFSLFKAKIAQKAPEEKPTETSIAIKPTEEENKKVAEKPLEES